MSVAITSVKTTKNILTMYFESNMGARSYFKMFLVNPYFGQKPLKIG